MENLVYHDLSSYLKKVQRFYDLGIWNDNNTLHRLLDDAVSTYPDNIAFRDIEFNISLTYKELDNVVYKLVHSFMNMGLKKGDVICFQIANSYELYISHIAASCMGLVSVLAHPSDRGYDLDFILNHSRAKAYIRYSRTATIYEGLEFATSEKSSAYYDLFMNDYHNNKYKYLKHIITVGERMDGIINFSDLLEIEPIEIDKVDRPLADDPYTLEVTSGSTDSGKKMSVHSHNNRIYRAHTFVEDCKLTSNDSFLNLSPFSHGFAILTLRNAMDCGGTYINTQAVDKTIKHVIEEGKPTMFMAPAGLVTKMRFNGLFDDIDLSSLRYFYMTAGAASEDLKRYVDSILPNGMMLHGYSLSEFMFALRTSGSIPESDFHRYQTVGHLPEYVICKIIDDNNNDVGKNVEGEIVFAEDCFARYLDNKVAEDETVKNGWFHTGDIGKITDDNYLMVTGRIKNIIYQYSNRFNPVDLEKIIEQHPKILQAIVVSRKTEYKERVYCYAKLTDNNTPINKEELNEFLSTKTSLTIDFIRSVDDIPLNRRGKFDRIRLEKRANRKRDGKRKNK